MIQFELRYRADFPLSPEFRLFDIGLSCCPASVIGLGLFVYQSLFPTDAGPVPRTSENRQFIGAKKTQPSFVLLFAR